MVTVIGKFRKCRASRGNVISVYHARCVYAGSIDIEATVQHFMVVCLYSGTSLHLVLTFGNTAVSVRGVT